MKKICLFEDHTVKNFLPLVHFRAIDELRSGACTLGERITNFFPNVTVEVLPRATIHNFIQSQRKCISSTFSEVLFINARVQFTDALHKIVHKNKKQNTVFVCGENIVALYCNSKPLINVFDVLSNHQFENKIFSEFVVVEVEAKLYSYLWDIIHKNSTLLEEDFYFLKKNKSASFTQKTKGAHFLNKKNIILGKNITIKPGVVIDAENGPVIIGDDVTILPNAVIIGPVFIGKYSLVKVGAKIYGGTSIGEWSKIGGEIEASIIQSHSNKQHEGFLGHSYLGSWVNLGADTNTSDLKNNYSNIRIQQGGEIINTKVQFLGSIIGDHSKTGINVMLDTGTSIGASSNIYGANIPPKYIPDFSWGNTEHFEEYEIEKSIATARIMMKRRNIEMTREYEIRMREVFNETINDRISAGVK
ncbi:MAG: putative sugar nucleotidyl transferase [Bacteroidota bacterium]